MHTQHDKLGRRPRHLPASTGKRVSPRERDIHWFEMLHRHGDLPSDYLHEFSKEAYPNARASGVRLTDLFHEGNTPDGGAYLNRPLNQFKTLDPRNNKAVYRVNARSLAVLERQGRKCENAPPYSNAFQHDLFRSCVTASIHLACRESGHKYIFGDEILTQFGIARSFATTYRYVTTEGKERERTAPLTPDDLLAIQYPNGNKVLFLIEIDRGNEATDSDNTANKSLSHNILMYRELIGRKVYQDYFKKPLPIIVLYCFTRPSKMNGIMNFVERIAKEGNNFIAFRSFDDFGELFHPPAVMKDILTTPWQRAGKPPLYLNEL